MEAAAGGQMKQDLDNLQQLSHPNTVMVLNNLSCEQAKIAVAGRGNYSSTGKSAVPTNKAMADLVQTQCLTLNHGYIQLC